MRPEQRCIKYVTALKYFTLFSLVSGYLHSFGLRQVERQK